MLEEFLARVGEKPSVASVVITLAVLPFLPVYLFVQGIRLGLGWIFSATRNPSVSSADVSAPTIAADGAEEPSWDSGKPLALPNPAGEIAILANAHDSNTQAEGSIRRSELPNLAASDSDPPGKNAALVTVQASRLHSGGVAPDGGVRPLDVIESDAAIITKPVQHQDLSPPGQPQGGADVRSSQAVYPRGEASMAQGDISEGSKVGIIARQPGQLGGTGPKSSGDTPAGDASSLLGASSQNQSTSRHPDRVQAAVAPPPVTGSKLEATGSAAILARLRQQRASSSRQASTKNSSGAPPREAIIAYASQTGTAQEIARNIQAQSSSHGIKSKVMSCNELGFEELAAAAAAGKQPVVVFVASSTGDGDAPDNSAKFYATLRRKTQPAGILKGLHFTVLGLGDSNYTRFCAVPRGIRNRCQDLGGICFFAGKDADEVDGLEATVDGWVADLWGPLQKILSGSSSDGVVDSQKAVQSGESASDASSVGLVGVPPLPACRIDLRWESGASAAQGPAEAEGKRPTATEREARDPEGMYSALEPFWGTVTGASYLTAPWSDRKVVHMEVSIEGSGMRYHPGDSLGILPSNDPVVVERLLECLGQDGAAVFSVVAADDAVPGSSGAEGTASGSSRLLPHLGWPCTLRHALLYGCDLTSIPRKSLLRLLGEHCTAADERRELLLLSSRGGKAQYDSQVKEGRLSLLDILSRFPSCRPPLAALLDALPPLMPRMYSIASSPLLFPDTVHVRPPPFSFTNGYCAAPPVAFSVVRYNSATGEKQGVCTSWLEGLCRPFLHGEGGEHAGVHIPVFLRRGGAFGLPASTSAPLLMIGPGTGVAPFRGFLQHRRALSGADGHDGSGQAVLYFGCRRREEDYLYGDQLEKFCADGTLTRLAVAFSRAQEDKVYVQHLLAQQAAEVAELMLDDAAHIYVCGDGAAMAKGVHTCLLNLLVHHGGFSAEQAAEKLVAMTKQGRYVRDIWS